jgi:hypothetical protein
MKHYVDVEEMDSMNIAVRTFRNDILQLSKVQEYEFFDFLTKHH